MMLAVVMLRGTPEQQRRVEEILTQMKASDDPLTAELAGWASTVTMEDEELIEALDLPVK